jgi:hypothetical protein
MRGGFTGMTNRTDVTLAYAVSLGFVRWLVGLHGEGNISILLSKMNEGRGFDDAFVDVYNATPEAYDARWRREL